MNKLLLLFLLLVPLGLLVWWGYHVKGEPPSVPFARVRRDTLVSTLPTNGKVEPIEWQPVRAEVAGLVEKVPVQEGQAVAAGATLAVLRDTGLEADVRAADARIAKARADLANVEAGGRGPDVVEIENSLAKSRVDLENAQREYASLRRLAEKQAATPVEVQQARGRVRDAELQIESLQRRRAALVGRNDRSVALANLQDAESALKVAREHVAQMTVHAPLGGIVYGLAVRPGTYVNPGDLVANVGRIDQVRVRVYVDEPELGRVNAGQPVTITWDALPGRKWTGSVERKPTEIVPLGTRQVGEVLCTIANPGRELLPGTNVNADIRTVVVENALSVPREAIRREAGVTGVYVLRGDALAWQPVQSGASSVTRVQVVSGLAQGDAVALPTDLTLKPGMRVKPVLQ